MAFEAKLTEKEAQDVVVLLDHAVRAQGLAAARAALPIVLSLENQVRDYNNRLIEQPPEPPKPLSEVLGGKSES